MCRLVGVTAVLVLCAYGLTPVRAETPANCPSGTMECARSEIQSLVSQETNSLKQQGYDAVDQTRIAIIEKAGNVRVELQLDAKFEYAVVGACGTKCDHAHIELSSPSGPLAQSPETQPVVILSGKVPTTTMYIINLSAPGCHEGACAVGLTIVHKAAAAPTTTPATAEVFNGYDNFDMVGGDLKKIQKVDQNACSSACQTDEQCIGYSYDKWNRWCFTKKEMGAIFYTARSLTAFRAGRTPANMSKGDISFEHFRNKGFPTQGQNREKASTFEVCQEMCAEQDWCAAFTFFKSEKICERFRSTGEYFSKNDSDSGAKKQETASE